MLANIIDSYITERGEFQLTQGYQPFDSLFYLKSGVFSCTLGQDKTIVTPGMIAVFDHTAAMSRHVIEPISFLYIKFTNKNAGTFPTENKIFASVREREKQDLERIEELSHDRTRFSLELREHYLNDLLLCLYGVGKGYSSHKEDILFPSTLDLPISYMKENLARKISVEELARYSGMSQSSLESKFRRLTGTSVYGYLILLRQKAAVRLLTETSLPVAEIAYRCGYDNLFYFCNAFKKQTGMTPTEYRKSNII